MVHAGGDAVGHGVELHQQRARERDKFKALGLNPDPPSIKEAKDPALAYALSDEDGNR